MVQQQLQIAVGIIRDKKQHILLAQRQSGSHLAGYWEFPGGKVEQGESLTEALYRELEEEIGIRIEKVTRYTSLEYSYPERHLILHFFLVESWQGEPYGREQQSIRWVAQQELKVDEFPSANQTVVNQLLAELEK